MLYCFHILERVIDKQQKGTSLSKEFVFTFVKRGVVSVGTDEEPRPRLVVVWRHALQTGSDLTKTRALETPGTYLLVDMVPSDNGLQTIYVGKSAEAKDGLGQRLKNHYLNPKEAISEWHIAVCFTGDESKSSLPQKEAAVMEHVLWEKLSSLSGINLANSARPTGRPEVYMDVWDKYRHHAANIFSLISILGVDLEKKPKQRIGVQNKPKNDSPEQPKIPQKGVGLLISANLLQVGELLRSSRKKPGPTSAEAAVANEQGHIKLLRYGKMEDGTWITDVSQEDQIFKTPSAAAKGVTKTQSEQGWKFWVVASSGKTLAELRDEYQRLR